MAVTLFQKTKVINRITIINGKKEKNQEEVSEPALAEEKINKAVSAKLRGKMYGRRTINRR